MKKHSKKKCTHESFAATHAYCFSCECLELVIFEERKEVIEGMIGVDVSCAACKSVLVVLYRETTN